MKQQDRQWISDLVSSFERIVAETPDPAQDPVEFHKRVARIARRVKQRLAPQPDPRPVVPPLPDSPGVTAVFSTRISHRKRD